MTRGDDGRALGQLAIDPGLPSELPHDLDDLSDFSWSVEAPSDSVRHSLGQSACACRDDWSPRCHCLKGGAALKLSATGHPQGMRLCVKRVTLIIGDKAHKPDVLADADVSGEPF